jgi:hypothetical protein
MPSQIASESDAADGARSRRAIRLTANQPLGVGPAAESEPEGAAFGVSADRPPRTGVDDATAELLHALKRAVEVIDGEVRQRNGVARPAPALVHADLRIRALRLPPAPLLIGALGERCAEET